MKISLNWLKEYVAIKGTADRLADQLTQAGLKVEKLEKVSGDFILETEVTTNRPDWLSHLGVARELHAITGARFSLPPFQIKEARKTEQSFKISVPDPDFCPYYSASLLEDVAWAKTPEFMKRCLEACGVRSINLIVDITNYVLLEWGQPLHAFDRDRLRGNEIVARRARAGENLTAIDGTVYDLKDQDLIIADSKGPIAIGGVMGGKDSEVTESTRNILLESAYFVPSRIRTTSRRLGLTSESSYRFERGVDPAGVDSARERAVYLISQYARAGRISSAFRGGRPPIQKRVIKFDLGELKKILGIEIPKSSVHQYFKRLGLGVSPNGRRLTVEVPSFRSDLKRSQDLIEELARLYGYDRIPETLPSMVPLKFRADSLLELEDEARDLCVEFGLQEVVTYTLVESKLFERLGIPQAQWVRLNNPQNQELNLMRPNLIAGLLQTVRRNVRVGETDIRLFEVGNRYLEQPGKRLPLEERMAAFVVCGKGRLNWLEKMRNVSFYDMKGLAEALVRRLGIEGFSAENLENPLFERGQGISLTVGDQSIGFYGTLSDRILKIYDLDQPVFYAELSLQKIAPLARRRRKVKDLPKFPSSPRDLTVIVDEGLKSQAIIERIQTMAEDLATKIEVFDSFRGAQIPRGKKSLSFRIFYQAKDRTLQNEEVNKLHFSIIDSLNQSFGAELPKAK